MSTVLFEKIANDLRDNGYSVNEQALPNELCLALYEKARAKQDFHLAGVGRKQQHTVDTSIRSDAIRWINGDCSTEIAWQEFTEHLKNYLNQCLFLGLSYYESHFAHYAKGAFYQKHLDAFRGQSNRVLSTVLYLNPEWHDSWGGELALYNEQDQLLETVRPNMAKLVVFLSEEFPHEVKPANSDRYSIAGWFRN